MALRDDPELMREYKREWTAKRRAAWFRDKQCVRCGSVEKLELDHVDPALKVSHSIWSWSEVKRDAEILKCQVLCKACHLSKTAEGNEGRYFRNGESHPNSKLSKAQVEEIRSRWPGESQVSLAREYGVVKQTIWEIVHGHIWN